MIWVRKKYTGPTSQDGHFFAGRAQFDQSLTETCSKYTDVVFRNASNMRRSVVFHSQLITNWASFDVVAEVAWSVHRLAAVTEPADMRKGSVFEF